MSVFVKSDRARFGIVQTVLGLLYAVVLVMPAQAADVKFNRCLKPSEVKVEQLIRHGIFLREASERCNYSKPGTEKMWKDFDQKFGPNLRKQTDTRIRLFQRQFKDDALKVMTYFDGRLVTYYRNLPITTAFCEKVNKQLEEISRRGWASFAKQSNPMQNEVMLDYKVCQ